MIALVLALSSIGQLAADAPSTAIVGLACVDLDEDDACTDADLPLKGAAVRLASGLSSTTDDNGRFHIAAAGLETRSSLDGSVLPRPRTSAVFVDARVLGPGARLSSPPMVTFVPAGVASVDLPVRLPERKPAIPPRIASDRAPTSTIDGGFVVDIPLDVAPGHTLPASVSVPLDGRESIVTLADRAPDGRLTLARLRVLRVPRDEGGDLIVAQSIDVIATFDLPPADVPIAPGPLLVPVSAKPGTRVRVGDVSTIVGERGRAFVWTVVDDGFRVEAEGGGQAPALRVDAMAGFTAHASGDLRVGAAGLTPFAQGRFDGELRLPIAGGSVAVGTSIDDDVIGAALNGSLLLQPRRFGLFGRLPDPEIDLAVFGDRSVTTSDNPGELALWARAQTEYGIAGLGPSRTPLDEGEVGRADRPILGPYGETFYAIEGVRIGVEAAADATSLDVVSAQRWSKAHDEIDSTGGRVYWLSRRDIAPGSARLSIELIDPMTGLVVERRFLEPNVDYEIDNVSGRILLAAPLGLTSANIHRPGAFGLSWQPRIVADYAYAPRAGETPSTDGAARAYVAAGEVVEAGARVGMSQSSTLLGLDVSAAPLPFVSLAASAARSTGDPFAGGTFARSRDAGLSFVEPLRNPVGGDAVSFRARAGSNESFVATWGLFRDAGYADGSFASVHTTGRIGAEGRVNLFDVAALGAVADARTGADPTDDTGGARLSSLDVAARADAFIGQFRISLDGLHRQATLEKGGIVSDGSASAAGAELGWKATEDIEVFVGHLQGILREGDGPGAADPTLTSVGGRVALSDDARFEGRLGVQPDLTPVAAVNASVDDDNGISRYGSMIVTTDAPWVERGATSVSGARQALGPDAIAYAEDRFTSERAARAMGVDVRQGPFFVGMSLESGQRVVDELGTLRVALSSHGGFRLQRLSLQTFGEVIGYSGAGFALTGQQIATGVAMHVTPVDDISLGARALIARGAPIDGSAERPFAELFLGGAWRPSTGPDTFLHYSLREDLRVDGLLERLQLMRASIAIGRLPRTQVLLSAQGVQHELVDDAAQALIATGRLTIPIWLLEPAVELGARTILGGGLDGEFGGTARAEVAVRLGPVAFGLGAVVLGYTGSGYDELTLDPAAPPVYVVVRGAVQ